MSDKKAGRPPLPEGEVRSATVSIRVRPAAKRRLRRTAVALGVTASECARQAFAIGMRELEKGIK